MFRLKGLKKTSSGNLRINKFHRNVDEAGIYLDKVFQLAENTVLFSHLWYK